MTLLERLEAATEGSRALDAEIKCLVGGACGCADLCSLRYTTSLDAALTLVPDGWVTNSVWETDAGKWGWALYRRGKRGEKGAGGNGATAALALVTAALKARAP